MGIENTNAPNEKKVDNKEGCEINLISLKSIDKLTKDEIFPFFYGNALQAVWLQYATNYLVKQDESLVENYYENQRDIYSMETDAVRRKGRKKVGDSADVYKNANKNGEK